MAPLLPSGVCPALVCSSRLLWSFISRKVHSLKQPKSRRDRLKLRAEVCVVGGGPAGSTIANRLAKLGHDVLLVEAAKFPRSHVGESLSAGILPLLDQLGVRFEVEEAGFLRPQPPIIRWGNNKSLPTEEAGAHGFQVDRGAFDQLLIRAAVRLGVRLQSSTRIYNFQHLKTGFWQLNGKTFTGSISIEAKFLIDACGRRGLMGGKKSRLSPVTIAIYGYWKGARLREHGNRIEAGEDRWYWAAPLADGSWNAIVFVSPDYLRGLHLTLKEIYRQLLNESDLLRPILEGQLVTAVRACNASSIKDEEPAGVDWLKVGEAAFALDPLSSQGVQNAIAQSLMGACVVHTILTNASPADVAISFYEERHKEAVERHLELAGSLYDEQCKKTPTLFWADRTSRYVSFPSPIETRGEPLPTWEHRIVCSAETEFPLTPVLQGDVVIQKHAIAHPALARRIAFLGGIPVADLLSDLKESCTISYLLTSWLDRISFSEALSIIRWLWQHRIIDDAEHY